MSISASASNYKTCNDSLRLLSRPNSLQNLEPRLSQKYISLFYVLHAISVQKIANVHLQSQPSLRSREWFLGSKD